MILKADRIKIELVTRPVLPLPGIYNIQQRVEEEETKTDWTLPLQTELIKVRTKRLFSLSNVLFQKDPNKRILKEM